MTALATILAEIAAQLPNNTSGAITPAILRAVLSDSFTTTIGQIPPVNAKNEGAIADGTGHPLSSIYASLAQAQTDFPFVTSLTQQLDWAACQLTSNIALGPAGSEHAGNTKLNLPMYFPAGNYQFGADTWLIRNTVGARFIGDGRTATVMQANNIVLQFDGLWYSHIEGMEFDLVTSGGIAALDMDGNVPGHPYATRGVQANTLIDVLCTGGGSTYAFAVCRLGQSGGQGSEMQYLGLHLSNASFACLYQFGSNAIDNIWLGGDCQNYSKHGVFLDGGSMGFFKVSFESTQGYTQIANDGFDIDASSFGAGDTITVMGCRSESLRFYRGSASQPADLRGINQQAAALNQWFPSEVLTLNSMVKATATDGHEYAYRVTTAGVTGGSHPTWPVSGTVSDGSVVWTQTTYNVVDMSGGEIAFRTCSFEASATVKAPSSQSLKVREVVADYTLERDVTMVLADPTSNAITVTLIDPNNENTAMGHTVVVKRATNAAHAVTVSWSGGSYTLLSGTKDAATFTWAGAGLVSSGTTWYQIGYFSG